MKFTEEIFKRASMRGVADYLLFGLATNEDTRDYETRLDNLIIHMRNLKN